MFPVKSSLSFMILVAFVLFTIDAVCSRSTIRLVQNGIDFPFFEFYGGNKSTEAVKVRENSCINYDPDSTTKKKSCCSCYDSCVKLNNCCIDKFWNRKNQNMTLDSYFNEFVQIMNQNVSRYECNPIFESDLLSTIKGSSSEQYMMISTCLSSSSSSSSNEDDFMKCMSSNYTDMLQSLPVWSETTNDLYRSASCARCNNVQSYTPLNITITCKTRINYLNKMADKGCKFQIKSLEVLALHRCFYKHKKNTCTNQKLKQKCNSFTAPLFGSYANSFCLECAEGGESQIPDFDMVMKLSLIHI